MAKRKASDPVEVDHAYTNLIGLEATDDIQWLLVQVMIDESMNFLIIRSDQVDQPISNLRTGYSVTFTIHKNTMKALIVSMSKDRGDLENVKSSLSKPVIDGDLTQIEIINDPTNDLKPTEDDSDPEYEPSEEEESTIESEASEDEESATESEASADNTPNDELQSDIKGFKLTEDEDFILIHGAPTPKPSARRKARKQNTKERLDRMLIEHEEKLKRHKDIQKELDEYAAGQEYIDGLFKLLMTRVPKHLRVTDDLDVSQQEQATIPPPSTHSPEDFEHAENLLILSRACVQHSQTTSVIEIHLQPEDNNNNKPEYNIPKTEEEACVSITPNVIANSPPKKRKIAKSNKENQNPNAFAKVVIGTNGTAVSQQVLDSIKWEKPTDATRKLMGALFKREIMATHSLTGKPSPAHTNLPTKKQLDPAIIQDIIAYVSSRCKVNVSVVRTAITTKCADENKMLRMWLKKQSPPNAVVTKQ